MRQQVRDEVQFVVQMVGCSSLNHRKLGLFSVLRLIIVLSEEVEEDNIYRTKNPLFPENSTHF